MITATEMIDYATSKYPVPELKVWNPSEYDMKYRYNTPRKLKKLESDKEKENSKLRLIYFKELQQRSTVFDIINDIELMPAEIADLFYSTLKWQVEDGIKIRNKKSELETQFRAKYDDKSKNEKQYCDYTPFQIYETILRYYKDKYDLNTKSIVYQTDESCLNYLNRECSQWKNVDVNDFIKTAQEYKEIKSLADNSLLPPQALHWGTLKLNDIIVTMRKLLNGDPERCETEPNWGVGGYFNAILVKGTARVSFKSFIAGGWNIQRRHIRARMTKLKEL